MLSIGAQGGTSNQQSDRYSGSDSSAANTAIQQSYCGAAILTRSLGNYLVTSPNNAMSAIRTDMPRHSAMTATIVRNKQRVDILDMATSTFDKMPLWILQRLANANIDPSSASDSLLLERIVHNASEFMAQRIEQGEELRHDALEGVVGHVDGQGQCFIDNRNILNGVHECPKISRNTIINDLIDDWDQPLGLETAQVVFKSAYDVEEFTTHLSVDFVSKYVDGKLQSGVSKLWYAIKQDNKHYVVVSSVEGESWCVVTAIFPCYGDYQCNDIAIVKAGVISVEQLKTPMVLFSHGALINPYLPSQLTHFAPIILTKQIRDEDLLNQCCIFLSPDVNHINYYSTGQYNMDITHLDIDKLISARAKTQTEKLPNKIKRLEIMRKQTLTYDYFSDWAGHMFTMIGLRLKAEDKAVIKRNKFKDLLYQSSWKQWNNTRQCNKHYGKITTTLETRIIQRVLIDAICNWKSDFCSKVSYREKQITVVKSTLMAWIRRRRDRKFDISSSLQKEFSDPFIISKDLNDSMAPMSAQECQMDLSSSEICHSNKPPSQPGQGTLCVKLKRKQCHIKQSLYAWHFVTSWNQIKLYREKSLCDHVLKEWRKIAYCIIFRN
jgi:hypothetical protein